MTKLKHARESDPSEPTDIHLRGIYPASRPAANAFRRHSSSLRCSLRGFCPPYIRARSEGNGELKRTATRVARGKTQNEEVMGLCGKEGRKTGEKEIKTAEGDTSRARIYRKRSSKRV